MLGVGRGVGTEDAFVARNSSDGNETEDNHAVSDCPLKIFDEGAAGEVFVFGYILARGVCKPGGAVIGMFVLLKRELKIPLAGQIAKGKGLRPIRFINVERIAGHF